MTSTLHYVIPYVLLLAIINSNTHIRAVSSVLGLGADLLCSRVPGITPSQRRICTRAPDAIVAISEGARVGIGECQRQFRAHRWNCSLQASSSSVFGYVVLMGSREAAFTYAIMSAGVAYSVTASCARGNISTCGCDDRKRGRYSASGWKWGGCSADIKYGIKFARKFVDAREVEGDARALMNLHNNKAGRRAVKKTLRTECKCHGVSGSCTMKTCWKTLPAFSTIGRHLVKKYQSARAVVAHKVHKKSSMHLALQRKKARRPRPSHLVFLDKSPNYCDFNPATGSLGTVARKCNRSSAGPDGCDLMCCGRGYNTHQYTRKWKCNCKFHWCCYVECNTCQEETEEYTCK
ncbi:protein Wnt-7b-like isoform X1 [Penaeus japonicus]|uniref:protein Wnt-7b-like isoform X1 n=1 Tax=Penaeus japonicus TaxID=27405 RepID=UPI001C70F517|nr:protein Wnt-7b-like isoform X1 [Penaeus japonicus]XP_042879896.1 protein Wnt-7b-like isoform X1 [Penaeus japonicus]